MKTPMPDTTAIRRGEAALAEWIWSAHKLSLAVGKYLLTENTKKKKMRLEMSDARDAFEIAKAKVFARRRRT